jgi:hypothetical protein
MRNLIVNIITFILCTVAGIGIAYLINYAIEYQEKQFFKVEKHEKI